MKMIARKVAILDLAHLLEGWNTASNLKTKNMFKYKKKNLSRKKQ